VYYFATETACASDSGLVFNISSSFLFFSFMHQMMLAITQLLNAC